MATLFRAIFLSRIAEKHRPRSVTWLSIVVLLFGGFHLLRLMGTFRNWDFLAARLFISPAYLFVTGGFWFCLFLGLAVSLWIGWSWAPRLMAIVVAGYLIEVWFDRLVLSGKSWQDANLFFLLGLSVLLPLFLTWFFGRSNIRSYFGESYERKP